MSQRGSAFARREHRASQRIRRWTRQFCLLSTAIACVLSCPAIQAATFTWTNVTGNWSEPTNWVEGVAPSGADPSDILTFGGAVPYTAVNDLPGVFLLNQMVLDATVAQNISGAPAGSVIRFTGNSPAILQNGSGAFTFSPGVTNPVRIDIDSATTFGGTGTGQVTFDGAISGGAGIIKTGPSVFRFGTASNLLPSDNTFYGGITINDGILRFNNNAMSGPSALRGNRITFGSPTAELRVGGSSAGAAGELRSGEWSGASGVVLAQNTSAANNDGLEIVITALADATFSGSVTNTPTGTGDEAELIVRGIGTQTLNGTVSVNDDLIIGQGAGLTLAGTASLGLATRGSFVMNGGTLTLDNRNGSGGNNNNRLRDASATSTGLDAAGGGTFSLIGNESGTTETVGRLQLGTASNVRSGAVEVNVMHTAGDAAATVLTLRSYSRDNTIIHRNTVDFTANDAAGNPLTLGLAGNNPRITIQNPVNLQNGLLSSSNFADNRIGWATVNGSDFATYDVGQASVAAVATSPFTTGALPSANTLLTSVGVLSNSTEFAINSLKIQPDGAGQTLDLSGTGNMSTNAILLAGDLDYAITSSGGGGISGPGGPRYFHVQNAMLSVSAPASVNNADIVKAGEGTLALLNNSNGTGALTINAGTVRAAIAALPAGQIQFRGGVLEITGGGTYNPTLGIGAGNINWTAGGEDRGSGGFAAVGDPVTIDLNLPGPDSLAWEQTNFVNSGFGLIFGSTRADSLVTFADHLNLIQPGVGNDINYNARQIRVIDNPNSTSDFARLSGIITSSPRGDLLKVGDGILELTNDNTQLGGFNGGVIVADGSLLLAHSNALGNAAYVLIGTRSGTASNALLTSNPTDSITINRDINIQAGTSGNAILGNTAAPGSTAADSTFSGNLTLGMTGSNAGRLVQFTAEPGTTVTFGGSLAPVSGYEGTMNLEKIGGGTVTLAGPITHTGATTVTAGTLNLNGSQSHGAGSVLNANGGVTNVNSDGGANLTVNVNAPTNFGSTQHLAALNIAAGRQATIISGGGKVLQTPSLNLDPAGKLDLTDHKLIVQATGATRQAVAAEVTSRIASAFNSFAWDGPGITSSTAAGDLSLLTTIGVMLNDDGLGGPFYNEFAGEAVDANSVLARFTYYGDADLNGYVDGTDYALIDNGFNTGASDWFNGDFDYNGIVDGTDYALIDNAFNAQGAPLSGLLGSIQAVPEPTTWVLLLFGAAALIPALRRNRGKRS